MKRSILALAIALCLVAVPLRAEPVPEYVLDKDFNSCMGGENPAQDIQRRDYCLCIRDSMKSWSLDQYGQVAEAGANAHNSQQEPPQLQAIAAACIAKILR